VAVLDTLPDAQRRWTGAVETRMRRTVWATGGCVSWYQNAAGRNPTLWPGSTISFRRATRRIDTAEFEIGGRAGTMNPVTANEVTANHGLATSTPSQQEAGR